MTRFQRILFRKPKNHFERLMIQQFLGGGDSEIKEVSGIPPLMLPDSVGSPLTAYSITGATEQDGEPSPESPVEVKGVGVKTGNLLAENDLLSGYWGSDLRIISPTSKIYKSFKIDLPQGTYTLSSEYNTRVIGFVINGTYSTDSKILPWTFTISEPQTVYASFRLESNVNWDGWVMFNEGSEPLPYEPFGYKIPILTSGKNLIGEIVKNEIAASVDGNFMPNPDGIRTGYIKVAIGESYTISAKYYPFQNYISFYNENKQYLSRTGGTTLNTPRVFKVPEGAFYMVATATATTGAHIKPVDYEDFNCQIELGTTATAYEPYTETITTIYTDRQLYSGDKISYPENQRITKTGVLILDGSQSRLTYSESGGYFRLDQLGSKAWTTGFCSHYSVKSDSTRYDMTIYSKSSGIIWIYDSRFSDLDSYKAYLSEQYNNGTPVTIYYELAEPTTETITLPEIPTLAGTNVLSVQTEVQPENVKIRYKTDKKET